MTEPTKREVDGMLAECAELGFEKQPASMRFVMVDHLVKLAAARGYDPDSAERIAHEIVLERAGSREPLGDVGRVARNLVRRLAGRAAAPVQYVWIYRPE